MDSIEAVEVADYADFLLRNTNSRYRDVLFAKIILGMTDQEIVDLKIARHIRNVEDVRRIRRICKDRMEKQQLVHERLYGVC